jgi:nicotinamide-nucleotide amidase
LNTEDLVKNIQDRFIAQRWTLAIAESCTGGNLAASLIRYPGSSAFFLGSVVAYSNLLKAKLLGVDPRLIEDHGAVSPQVVQQMAEEIMKLSGSDYSIAVSGVAGPAGGTPEKPVGTVWGAIGKKGKEPFVWSFHLSGTRPEIIDQTVKTSLSQLWMQSMS